ncbi:MAG: hypothetical protein IPI48_11470 [bacterium]|nr:hypothetical protein [bacterium]
MKSILAILMLALACARPVPARTDTVESQGGTGALSCALSFCPLVTSSEKSGCGIGILTRVAF